MGVFLFTISYLLLRILYSGEILQDRRNWKYMMGGRKKEW